MLRFCVPPRDARVRVRHLFALVLAGTLAACSGDGDVVGNVNVDTRVVSVRVEPSVATVMAGRQVALSATALNASGATVAGQPFSWSSSAANIASVDAAGTVSAVAPGAATISATAAGVAGSAAITVTPDTVVASVTLTATSATLQVGGTVTLGAAARNAAGDTVFRQTFAWTSSAPNIASVNATGRVTALAIGSATITASTAGRSASAAINVIAPVADTLVASVNITPTVATVQIGGTVALGAVARNAAGQNLAGKPITWSSGTPSLATVNGSGVVTGVAAGGPVTITATSQGKSATASVTVAAPPSSTGTITVNGAQQFQKMTGWEALMEIGQAECDSRAYQTFKNEVLDRAAFELGINRIRVGLRNGFENPVDYWPQKVSGQLTFNQWNATWFRVVNDNADPFVINPAGFNFGFLDYTIEELIIPLKQRLATRGESFWFNISYTGANSRDSTGGLIHRDNPEEYAELILATFQHIYQKYGFIPNSLELVNEPNIGGWSATQVANNLVAAQRRLAQAGFFPEFVGPTASGVVATTQYFDTMIKIPGVSQHLKEVSFHRFGTTTPAFLQGIAQRASQYGMRTAMLEHGGSGYEHLHEDLVHGNVSAWQQFGLAFCGDIDGGGVYFLVTGAKVGQNSPVVNTGRLTKHLRQYFRYVSLGAVRIGASSTNAAFDPVAFRNVNGKHVVVVKATAGGSFTVGGLPAGTYGIDYTTTTDYMKPLADVSITGAQAISTAIPAAGVLTIYAK